MCFCYTDIVPFILVLIILILIGKVCLLDCKALREQDLCLVHLYTPFVSQSLGHSGC